MEFDYSKLKGRIIEKFETYDNFAKAMDYSNPQLSDRLNNKCEWKSKDIYKASQLLDLDNLKDYFFTPKQ